MSNFLWGVAITSAVAAFTVHPATTQLVFAVVAYIAYYGHFLFMKKRVR